MSGEGLTIDRPALEALAALLLERAGLKITPDGYYGLRLALLARLPALGLSDATDYVRRLKQLAGEAELRSLLPLVTVGKTEFFRDSRQFLAFERDVLPGVLQSARRESRVVKLWSAGCATGEEPYSLAMAAIERGAFPGEVDIWATDLNPAAVENAAKGQYPARRLIGVSEERLARFFLRKGESYEITQEPRALVRFEGHNLAAPVWPHVRPESLDVIFCRNVIIYFDLPTIVGVMQRFHDALLPNGWLFLGYSESLFKVATRFDMVEVGGIFAYRKAPQGESRPLRTLEDFVSKAVLPPRPGASAPAPLRRAEGPTPAPSMPPLPASSAGTVTQPRQPPPPPLPPPPTAGPASSSSTSSTSLPVVRASVPLGLSPPAASAPRARPTGPLPAPTQPPRPTQPPPAVAPPPAPSPSVRTPVERLAEVIRVVELGDFPKALRLATRLAGDAPDDLAAQLTLGNVHALMGNLDEAELAYGQALAREPLCVEARVYLALAFMQGKTLDRAKQELTRALFLEPTLALGHYLLGQVLERQHDPEGARRSYRNAVAQKKAVPHPMVGHFPDLPRSNDAIAQAAQYRLAALSEA